MILLKSNNLIHDWKRFKISVLKGLMNDDHFLCSNLYRKGMLSTEKLRTGFMSKLRSIKSYLSYRVHLKTVPFEVPDSKPKIKEIKDRKSYPIFKNIPLSFREKEHLTDYFGHYPLREAVKDAEFYGVHKIRMPYAFMMSRSREHAKKQMVA